MAAARYYIPQHPTLGGPHSKDELYLLVERGSIARGEIVTDRVTSRSHKVGELIDGMKPPRVQEATSTIERPAYQEFTGDTPWEMKGGGPPDAPQDEEDGELLPDEGADREGDTYEQASPSAEVFHGHPSWFAYTRWLVVAFLFAALGAAGLTLDWRLMAAGGLAASLTLCGVIIARQQRDYVITAERIEHEWGIWGRSSKEVRIRDVRSIDVDASGVLGVLGIGTLNVSSAGSEDIEVQFKHIRGAHKVKELIRQLQQRVEA
jgi:hypothetical protein